MAFLATSKKMTILPLWHYYFLPCLDLPLKSHLGILISFVFLKFSHQANDRKKCCAIPQHHNNNMNRILMFSVVESYLNHLVEFHQEN